MDSKNIILFDTSYFKSPFQLEWREIMSWYPTELVMFGKILLARGIAQEKPSNIWDDKISNRQWDPNLDRVSRIHLMQQRFLRSS